MVHRYLDISFCRHIATAHVEELRRNFPAVAIKNSLQNAAL